jgi:membrane protease YdiL (CAAX protease family)
MAEALRKLFINEEGESRSGWRAVLFFVSFLILVLLLRSAIKSMGFIIPSIGRALIGPTADEGPSSHAIIYFLLDYGSSLAAVVIATAVCARLLEHRSLASVGYKLHPGWQRDFAVGFVLGIVTLAVAIAIEYERGAASFHINWPGTGNASAGFVIVFVMFTLAAAFEELFFRGFAFQALIHNIGPRWAMLVAAIAFGLAHLGNPGPTLLSTTNTILAGVWLCTAYLITRSLWLSTALHCSWNLSMVLLFGLPVSGLTTFDQLGWLAGQDGSPVWLSGGAYGPEGGVAATVALILSTLIIWKSGLFNASEEMRRALHHGKPEPRFLSITPTRQV